MPWRELQREQGWLMPPTLEELLAEDHPARVVAAFVDSLTRAEWSELGIDLRGRRMGARAYHPRALLGAWLYGFMNGVRSTRKLEAACREQLPYLWLAGGQRPDHNTLWRFWQQHRLGLRRLFTRTVQAIARLDLIDRSVQAVDGTKIAAPASNRWTLNREQVDRYEQRTVRLIEELAPIYAQGNAERPQIGVRLREAREMLTKLRAAQDQLRRSRQNFVSLVDADARLMRRAHGGTLTGYNAQAVAVRMRGGGADSLVLLAAEVSQQPADNGELPRMVDAAAAAGVEAEMTVADAGYFTAQTLDELERRGMPVALPEGRMFKDHPYHWRHFRYDPVRDEYTCPEGETLVKRQTKYTRQTPAQLYGADPEVCSACGAFGVCTTSEFGRTITISEQARALERHRLWMESRRAREALLKRPALIEPVFAIIKERQAGRSFLLRGIEAVEAEWSLLATAFNLRALCKHWRPLAELLGTERSTAETVP